LISRENIIYQGDFFMNNIIKPGIKAPDFTLKNQHRVEINLESLKGKKVLLAFHPLAWTRVCELQMRALEVKYEELEQLNVVALGMSVDSQPCKKEWGDFLEIEKTHLLADFWPHGEVAQKYGVFIDKAGISGRANILIDEKGEVIFSKAYDIPEIPDIEEIIRFLKK
jgi:peroxiredoxin